MKQSFNLPIQNAGALNYFKNMSWKTIAFIVFLVIVLGIISYFIYTSTTKKNQKNQNTYSESNGKEAEIILFYVDWCPHCKTAKPEWEQVKSEYQGKTINGYTVVFTENNCTNESPEGEKIINNYKI